MPSKTKNFARSVPRLPQLSAIVSDWFSRVARDLPWRRTSDPYLIWISEIMLQQTTVATVIPYYERFVKRFPDLRSLAKSSESDVLKLWEGLGYYRRAKNLRTGAKLIVDTWSGRFPESREELLKVPGIGAYTAGAILSIAFRKPEAALDGNLIRVYSRLFAFQGDVGETDSLKYLWEIARCHTPQDSSIAREFTEGMMELGATVCTPRKPLCGACPVQNFCLAHKRGLESDLPKKTPKKTSLPIREWVFLHRRANKIGLLRRGADSRFPDFMRLPYQALKTKPTRLHPRFTYSIGQKKFEAYVIYKKPSAKLVYVHEKKLSEVILPAVDRKILNRLVFES